MDSVQSGLDPVTGSLHLCNSDYPSCILLHLLKVKWCERPLLQASTCSHQQHVLCRSHPYDDFEQGRDAGTLYRQTALADKTLPKSPALLPPPPISSHMRSFPLLSDNAPFPIPHYEYRAGRRCCAVDCMTIAESRLSEMLWLWHCISCLETGRMYQSSCNVHRNSYRPHILCSTKRRVFQFPELYCTLGKTSPRTKLDKCNLHTNATNKY